MQSVCGREDVEEAARWVRGNIDVLRSELAPGHDLGKEKKDSESGSNPPQSFESLRVRCRKTLPRQLNRSAAGQQNYCIEKQDRGQMYGDPTITGFAEQEGARQRHEEHQDRDYRQSDGGVIASSRRRD